MVAASGTHANLGATCRVLWWLGIRDGSKIQEILLKLSLIPKGPEHEHYYFKCISNIYKPIYNKGSIYLGIMNTNTCSCAPESKKLVMYPSQLTTETSKAI